MSPHVVKARSRQGTRSLDLTIPVKIATGMNIKEGDVFSVEAITNEEGKLIIIYTRILNNT
jgi:bifunctional DNA-binding transcriptional regulator/antitoxin component of YhaV-PrlF toxin-antitoxin module